MKLPAALRRGNSGEQVAAPEPLDRGHAGTPLLSVRDLRKYYPVTSGILNRHVDDVKAVDGVRFDLYPGETLAVVGESGCGKSTMAETVLGLESITGGEVFYDGQPLSERSRSAMQQLRREIQIIFQDPFSSLNERMTVGRIVREPLDIHGIEGDREARVAEMLAEVGLDPGEYYDRVPHELSGGQRQRVSIARSLVLNPSILVADEPVSALDVSIQAQILSLLERLQDEFDLTYLFISHDLSVVRYLADRVAVMYLGRIVEEAGVDALFGDPQHPYTEALLSDVPRVGDAPERAERIELEGSPPDPIDPPEGCNFHPRCHLKPRLPEADQHRCVVDDPELGDRGEHVAACHFRPPGKADGGTPTAGNPAEDGDD
jgi:oligopeptide/dipeptide ABC transporter ATP-binding protein